MTEYTGEERRASDRITRLETMMDMYMKLHTELAQRFISHMDNEERSFKAMYDKMDELNENIHSSFKERDKDLQRELEKRDDAIVAIKVAMARWIGGAVVVLAVLEYVVNKVI